MALAEIKESVKETAGQLVRSVTGRGRIDRETRNKLSLSRRRIVDSVKWAWFEEINYSPHRFQRVMHASLATTRASTAGTRGGKTEWGAEEGGGYLVAGPFRIWILGGSYALCAKEWRVILDACTHPSFPHSLAQSEGGMVHDNVSAGDMKLRTSAGGEVECISVDKPKKSAYGEEIDLVIISEAALIDKMGGEDGIWNKMLRGRLTSRLGDVIVPTTPAGQDDWLYPLFLKGMQIAEPTDDPEDAASVIWDGSTKWRKYYKNDTEPDKNYFSLQWPSWANRLGFLEDPIKLREELPLRIFMEQYMGMFVRWFGSIWMGDFSFDPNEHIIEPFYIPPWWQRIEVIDPGYSGLFAWLAAVIDEKGNIIVVDEYGDRMQDYDTHVAAIMGRRRAFYGKDYDPSKHIMVFVDPEDPQCRRELAERGLFVAQADNDVIGGFQAAAYRFKNDALHIFNTCTSIINSLKNHEWAKRREEGSKRKEANDAFKHHSDLMRYLNNAPIWPSEKPTVDRPHEETVGDMIESLRGGDISVLEMGLNEWMRTHAA